MKIRIVLVVIFLPLLMSAQDSTYKGIKWETFSTWEAIKTKAKAEHKYIFVECYATWCAPCHLMDKKVFANEMVGGNMNPSFISVKVQMDSTKDDNEQVRAWYNVAKFLEKKYEINGVPTYLFFSSDGHLIHRGNGYQKVFDFLNMASLAKAPEKRLMLNLYDKYKKGNRIKDYQQMMKLTKFTWKYIDKGEANKMAKECYENYLKKTSLQNLYTVNNLSFILGFPELIESRDRIFEVCYNQSNLFDSIIKNPGRAHDIVQSTIIREELNNKLLKNEKGIFEKPDWVHLQKTIETKYPKVTDVKHWFIDYKIEYYRRYYPNWRLWADARNEKLELFPPNLKVYKENWSLGGDLNQFGAWYAFLECNDTIVLKEALKWIDIALSLDSYYPPYIDTKAQLLYKLGRKEEAIKLEEIAVALSRIPENNWTLAEDEATLEKMRKGEVTWPIVSN